MRGLLILLALTSSGEVAAGQRLSKGFPIHDAGSLFIQTQVARTKTVFQLPRMDCSGSGALQVAAGAVGGAVGGWLTYELVVGIWRAAEGAPQKKGLRTSLTLGGAAIGAMWVIYSRRRCSESAGA